jgi:hypothetical protein
LNSATIQMFSSTMWFTTSFTFQSVHGVSFTHAESVTADTKLMLESSDCR